MRDPHKSPYQKNTNPEDAYGIKVASHETMWQSFLRHSKTGTIAVCVTIGFVMAVLTLG